MQKRRAALEGRDDLVLDILRAGCRKANVTAEMTLEAARKAAGMHFFPRTLSYPTHS
jgi:hypothetical protein